VDISINPQIRLFLDAEGKVLHYECMNDDAKEAFADLKLEGITLEDASVQICETAAAANLGVENGKIDITISQVFYNDEVGVVEETPVFVQQAIESVKASLEQKELEVEIASSATFVLDYDENFVPIKEYVELAEGKIEEKTYEDGELKESVQYLASEVEETTAVAEGNTTVASTFETTSAVETTTEETTSAKENTSSKAITSSTTTAETTTEEVVTTAAPPETDTEGYRIVKRPAEDGGGYSISQVDALGRDHTRTYYYDDGRRVFHEFRYIGDTENWDNYHYEQYDKDGNMSSTTHEYTYHPDGSYTVVSTFISQKVNEAPQTNVLTENKAANGRMISAINDGPFSIIYEENFNERSEAQYVRTVSKDESSNIKEQIDTRDGDWCWTKYIYANGESKEYGDNTTLNLKSEKWDIGNGGYQYTEGRPAADGYSIIPSKIIYSAADGTYVETECDENGNYVKRYTRKPDGSEMTEVLNN